MVSARPSPRVVLIVEDDPSNLKLLVDICAAEGYEPLRATNGELALAMMAARTVDVVLVDGAMPGMDGFDLCRRIRARSDVPVIMVSAVNEDSARERAAQAGANAFVSKPFRVFELVRQVRLVLSVRGTPSEPPDEDTRARRRARAAVLASVGGVMELRLALRRPFAAPGCQACVLVRLANDVQVVTESGRVARDGALGHLAGALMAVAGEGRVFSADQAELVALVSRQAAGELRPALEQAAAQARDVAGVQVQFQCGAVAFEPTRDLDVDVVLGAARSAATSAPVGTLCWAHSSGLSCESEQS